jgi:hypothetical protein
MDSTPAAAPVSPPRTAFAGPVLLLVAFAVYGFFLARHVGALAAGSDSSGYLNNARLLARAETAMPQRIPPGLEAAAFDGFTFMPLGFRPYPGERMAPTYPIGLPLLLLGASKLVGWALAPPIVMVGCALAVAALMIPLGRAAGLPRGWAVFGALLFAAGPLTTFMSVHLMSDIPATAAATATILCAWLSRRHRGFAPLAGALLALGVLIRPTNALLLAPVALCLGLDLRRWLLLGLGGLPGAAALLTYNTSAYGHPLVSGYGGIGPSFSTGFVPVTLEHYARWLPILLTPAGLLSLALPWFGRRERIAWVLVAWIVPLFAFYLAYRHTHEWWWYLRFLLPAFPACLIGGLWVGHRLWTLLPAPSLKLPHRARGLAVRAARALRGHHHRHTGGRHRPRLRRRRLHSGQRRRGPDRRTGRGRPHRRRR